MRIDRIAQANKFKKQWAALPAEVKHRARKCIEQFRNNPFHPSLRLHQLSGKLDGFWSISINRKYRIIFEVLSETALFQSIGTHAIYEKR
ncbi:MAG: type II toxin-antitoxin system mRNA interferase toxin, RelE/StbE family [Candidatus Peribacteraceae bacterium]|nr:type II toxin-antitoxin system mRNA interferase toxin, RelE/StbE family [Candidatus Peribacteraceae bacterium]